jgi:hypothetical protein
MKIEYAKDLRWSNESQDTIDLIVKWEHFSEEHPFTASLSDPENHGKKLFQDAVAGKYGEIKEFILVTENPVTTSPFPTPPSAEIPVVNIL